MTIRLYSAYLIIIFLLFIYGYSKDKKIPCTTEPCSMKKYNLSAKSDSLFNLAFEKMKVYYSLIQDPVNPRTFEPEFMNDFNQILKADSTHIPTLINAYYFTYLFRNNNFLLSHQYLEKLIKIDKNNSLIALLKFAEYEKLVNLSFIIDEVEETKVGKEALDSISSYANYLYSHYDCYYIRMKVIPYVSFKSFSEREEALIKTVNYIEQDGNREKILSTLNKFIEKYYAEPSLFHSFTNLREYQIKNYLRSFYYRFLYDSYFLSYLSYRCGIKYDSIENRIPHIDRYPIKYQNALSEFRDISK